jgi:tetratricopeptide (TPR) repeat protein
LNRENVLCQVSLAALYQQSKRWNDAAQAYEGLVAVRPDNVDFYWELGVLRARLGRFEAAEEAFRELMERAPESPRGYAGLAEVYLQSDRRLTEAAKLAREAVERRPIVRYHVLLARACAKAGDRPGAISAIDKAIQLEPGNQAFKRLRAQFQASR